MKVKVTARDGCELTGLGFHHLVLCDVLDRLQQSDDDGDDDDADEDDADEDDYDDKTEY